MAQGADVNCKDFAGWTALHEACNHGYLDVVKKGFDKKMSFISLFKNTFVQIFNSLLGIVIENLIFDFNRPRR